MSTISYIESSRISSNNKAREMLINYADKRFHFLTELMLATYLLLLHLHFIFAFDGAAGLLVVGGFNAIGMFFFLYIILKYLNTNLFIFSVGIFFLGLISHFIANNATIINYLTMFKSIGVAAYIYCEGRNEKIIKGMMTITLLLFIPVIINPLEYNMFSRVSKNYYSIILFPANFVFNDIYLRMKKPANLTPTIISLFIVIYAGGRAGILTYSMYLIGMLMINYDLAVLNNRSIFAIFKRYKWKLIKDVLVLLIFTLLLLFKFSQIEENTPKKSTFFHSPSNSLAVNSAPRLSASVPSTVSDDFGFARGFNDEARTRIYTEYLNCALSSREGLFFGVKTQGNPIFSRFDYNLHNSYLELHSQYGLLGFLIFLLLGISALQRLGRERNWGAIVVLLSVVTRGFTDSATMPGQLDPVIFYFLLSQIFNSGKYRPKDNYLWTNN